MCYVFLWCVECYLLYDLQVVLIFSLYIKTSSFCSTGHYMVIAIEIWDDHDMISVRPFVRVFVWDLRENFAKRKHKHIQSLTHMHAGHWPTARREPVPSFHSAFLFFYFVYYSYAYLIYYYYLLSGGWVWIARACVSVCVVFVYLLMYLHYAWKDLVELNTIYVWMRTKTILF